MGARADDGGLCSLPPDLKQMTLVIANVQALLCDGTLNQGQADALLAKLITLLQDAAKADMATIDNGYFR